MYISYIEMGERIAELRREHNMTQEQLSEELDISVKHCSEIERGLSSLSLDKLVLLCDILCTDLDYIVRGKDRELSAKLDIPDVIINTYAVANERQRQLLKEFILLFNRIKSSS